MIGRIAFALLVIALPLVSQDLDWVRDWEQAQKERPRNIGSVGRIAPAAEPGIPMIVRGRVLQADGRTPVAGVIVFAYQTDQGGLYNARGVRGWRLKGWAKSDAAGRFEFRTIRPGSYPGTRNPAHIHVTVDGPGVPRRWTEEIEFADDRFAGKHGLPVATRNGVQSVDYTIRLTDKNRF